MAEIKAVRRNSEGTMTDFKLDDGREMSFRECYAAVKNGEIQGVQATHGKEGVEIIRSVPDGMESNNLMNKPSF